jgi:hypothetical protein
MLGSLRWRKRAWAIVAAPTLLIASVGATEASGAGSDSLTPAGGIEAVDRHQVAKSATSRIAETDPALLGRTDATPIDVVVKLDHDPLATYAGTVDGLAATSPAVTGDPLSLESPAEQAYEGYLAGQEADFAADLAAAVPSADIVGEPLRVVYGGVRVTLPANRVADLLAVDGVVAVQQNDLRQPLTDSSTEFIGADTLYPGLGGTSNAGAGVIFGVLDSGAWPEHPSYADLGNLGAPPAKADGTPRTCDFGDNPLTAPTDPFVCNNKLISGEAFLDTYLSVVTDPVEPYTTARDSNGHGTHTGTTSAGNAVASTPVLGVDQGPANGVAPGAWVAVYKVCGILGCFSTDSAAAVEQAILDGVDVINFSISGGTNPLTDVVELAFLDAYAAGVFVAASAGNEGPGASTANHLSPWTTTVAASTQTREFQSTLTLTSSDGTSLVLTGSSITDGVDTATPVVLSSTTPVGDLCNTPVPAGTFTGVIVACKRGGNARVEKSFNVYEGGAVGMILYNPTLADTETDNHWLPTVHLADGTDFVAYFNAHPDVSATFTQGVKVDGAGDVMAAFSSRGPAGLFIKPDVTAPGVQILAGHTPTPESPLEGPPGNYYQAIAGTSMSSPHVAGAAILLKAMHPDWTPGQIKSALMTTATTAVVKEDLTTPADPFDMGAGRIDLTVAGNPGLTFDATADDMFEAVSDPLGAVHLNLPSINAPILPGVIRTTRTATNVSGRTVTYDVAASMPSGSWASVSPRTFTLRPGQSKTLTINIGSSAATAQYFGEITLTPRGSLPALHMPVAFVPQQGAVSLESSCNPTSIRRNQTTTCTVTATNQGAGESVVDIATTGNNKLKVVGATGATVSRGTARVNDVVLAGNRPGVPALASADDAASGFLPLSLFGVAPIALGDEEIVNFDVPEFHFAGRTYTSLGVTSNGYIVAGGGGAEDVLFEPSLPDPSAPNNVLAPYWTDLDGSTGAPGFRITTLTDGVSTWIVVEWDLVLWGTTEQRTFQTWIGINDVEDIWFAYDPANMPGDAGQPLAVGAENEIGEGAALAGPPTADVRVASSAATPGGSVTFTVTAKGTGVGTGRLTSDMFATTVTGMTRVQTTVNVRR